MALKGKLFKEEVIGGKLVFHDWEDIVSVRPDDIDKERWLYCFQCGPFYKIGLSDDWERRIRGMQPSNPVEITKVATRRIPAFGASYAEMYALHHLGPPVRGEWVSSEGKSKRDVNKIFSRAWTRATLYRKYVLSDLTPEDIEEWRNPKPVEVTRAELMARYESGL